MKKRIVNPRQDALARLEQLFGDQPDKGGGSAGGRQVRYQRRAREKAERTALRAGGLVAAAWRAGAGRGC